MCPHRLSSTFPNGSLSETTETQNLEQQAIWEIADRLRGHLQVVDDWPGHSLQAETWPVDAVEETNTDIRHKYVNSLGHDQW